MDHEKTGMLIRCLRIDKNLTQLQLAEKLNISDKTVSKWERGKGCPDISLLPNLADLLGVNLDELLSGTLNINNFDGGNMKNLKFYVCPNCGNILTATSEAAISCCGMKLSPLDAKKAGDDEKLSVEKMDGELFISSDHEMTKDHYISFVALLMPGAMTIRRQYPEWNFQLRMPASHGKLFWHCIRDGLFWQII